MIKAIVFDLDGTLLNTLADLANSCNHALATLGLPIHPEEPYKFFVGDGKEMLIRRALGEHETPERVEEGAKIFSTHYAAHGEDCTQPYEGIVPLLEELKAKGIPCAVVSNKPHEFCQTLVPKYFGDLISPVFGHVAGTPAKPDPRNVFAALEAMGVTQQEALYIGDTGVDMLTAKNSGLTSVGVLWGFRPQAELEGGGAHYICETPEELGKLIDGLI